jgi:hypothetical protein
MKEIVAQFIPILIPLLILTQFKPFLSFSHTVFGKFIAVCIIIFYTMIHKVLGLFVCALIIFYYQTDYVERMMNYYQETQPLANISTEEYRLSNFRSEHCIDSELTYKDMLVRNDVADLVFPEIVYPGKRCNVCDSNCQVRISDIKLTTENKLRETLASAK